MTSVGSSSDFRARFLKLFGYAVIAATVGVVVWGVLSVGAMMFTQAKHVRCQGNLKSLVEAITIYKSRYNDQLPPYLALLLPILEDRADKFQCPADPDKGKGGSRPEWLRRGDGDAFACVDLDGPSLDPRTDADSVPSSYLYAACAYPCGLANFQHTWREEFESLVRKHGKGVPLIRCYYHLPEKYVAEGVPPNITKAPDPDAAPTYNVTAELLMKTYRLDWLSEPEFSERR